MNRSAIRFVLVIFVTLFTFITALAFDGEVVWLDQINDANEYSYDSIQGYLTSSGELIISGSYENLEGIYYLDHIVVAKYNTDGTKVWQTEIRGDHSLEGDVYAVEDDDGAIFVAAGYNHMLSLTKLSASGSIIWTAEHEYFSVIAGIGIGPDGRVMVAGQGRYPGTYYDYFAFGSFYPSDEDQGLIYWDAHYGGVEGGHVNAIGAGMDAEGNMYVGGTATGLDQVQDFAMCAVNSSGLQIAGGEYTTGAEWSYTYDFVVAPDGRSYLCGEGMEYSSASSILVCFDNSGGISWTQSIGDGEGRYHGFDVELTTSGVAFLTHHDVLDPYQSIYDITFYNPAGDFLREIETSGNWNQLDTGMLCIDPSNNAYVVASEQADERSITAAKYDVNGNEVWVAEFGPVREGYNLSYSTNWVGWHAGGLFGAGVTSSGYNFDDSFLSFKLHEIATDVEEQSLTATEYGIAAAYPNPFNPSLTIEIELANPAVLQVEVYNALGQNVAQLHQGQLPAGSHSLEFDASGLTSGVYFIHATVPGKLDQFRKVVLMK
ncbi:hypothetical protein BMS3Bbin04_01096 [bacterium BMS3Bbin04]|nr:hypothetical protein BMS3Bbin04_01096 [bacterium BMS3Bbin04]